MHRLNLQLYARTTNGSFNEQVSVRNTVPLKANPTHVTLSIAAPEGEQILELRLDPNDKPSAFVLHRLNVASSEGQQLYGWNGTLEGLMGLSDIRPKSVNGRIVLECTSDDPNLKIALPSPHSGKVLLELSVSHALLPENSGRPGEIDPANAFQTELAEAILSLQSSFNHALEDVAAEIEGLQDALVINSVNARRESDVATQHIGDVIARSTRIEEQTSKLQDQLREETQAISNKFENVRVEEHFALLRECVQTEFGVLNASMRAGLGAAVAELSVGSQGEFAKLDARIASFADASQFLQQIRAELNVAQDEVIVPTVQHLLTEVRATRERISIMESSFAWRITRYFARFSKSLSGN